MADVLVVDDESAVRNVVTRWLSAAGHEWREAQDAHAALAVMAERPADVVLCDVQMPPGPDGLWLTGELRRLYPATAIVLATGVSSVPPTISMQCGVMAYLLKPLDRGTLLRAVEESRVWHQQALAAGPRDEDGGDLLTDWLKTIDTHIGR